MLDTDRFLDLARHRRSPYAFDIDAPVSDDDLRHLFEAARWVPSSYNEQPWRFVVGRAGDTTYTAIHDALKGKNQIWAATAPVLGLALASETFERSGELNPHRRHDTGAALMALSLAAETLGLGVHQMAGMDGAAAADALGVPDGFEPDVAFAIGRPSSDPESVVPPDLAERARTPKPRRSLSATLFGKTWGEPLIEGGD